jgi:nitrogen regulatory protein PII
MRMILPHECVGVLHKHNVGGMTFYDIKGRGHSKNEPIYVGTGLMKYVRVWVWNKG